MSFPCYSLSFIMFFCQFLGHLNKSLLRFFLSVPSCVYSGMNDFSRKIGLLLKKAERIKILPPTGMKEKLVFSISTSFLSLRN